MDIGDVKLIVSDIDGTLLDSASHLSDRTISVIKEVQKKRIPFALATGRTNLMTHQIVKKLGDRLYSITCNGALVYDHHNDKIIHSDFLDREQSLYILKEIRKRGWEYITYSKDCMYFSYRDKLIENRIQRACDQDSFRYKQTDDPEEIEDIDSLTKIGVLKYESVDENVVSAIAREAGTELKNSGEKFKAIFPSGISKETGLRKLQEYLNVKEENTIVFGDYDNDLPLFERAKYKAAMFNGSKRLKDAANIICRSNNEDGVAVFLEKLLSP